MHSTPASIGLLTFAFCASVARAAPIRFIGAAGAEFTQDFPPDGSTVAITNPLSISHISSNTPGVTCTFNGIDHGTTKVDGAVTVDVGPPQTQTQGSCVGGRAPQAPPVQPPPAEAPPVGPPPEQPQPEQPPPEQPPPQQPPSEQPPPEQPPPEQPPPEQLPPEQPPPEQPPPEQPPPEQPPPQQPPPEKPPPEQPPPQQPPSEQPPPAGAPPVQPPPSGGQVEITFGGAANAQFTQSFPIDGSQTTITDPLSISHIVSKTGNVHCTFNGIDHSVTTVNGVQTVDVGPPQTQVNGACNAA